MWRLCETGGWLFDFKVKKDYYISVQSFDL